MSTCLDHRVFLFGLTIYERGGREEEEEYGRASIRPWCQVKGKGDPRRGGEGTNVPYMTRMKNMSSGDSVLMQEVFSVAFSS